MGNCLGPRKQLKQIDLDVQMLNSENRIHYEYLLREITIIKNLLQSRQIEDNRRYSYNPVHRNEIKYV